MTVTSYQANFASHRTRAWHDIGNTTKYSVTFYLVHTTIPNHNRVTRIIITHTLGGNFKSFCQLNQKFQRFWLFSSTLRRTKGKQAAGQNRSRIGAYRVLQTLYWYGRCHIRAQINMRRLRTRAHNTQHQITTRFM